MAVVSTPLGFQKPEGNEPVRNVDDIISNNGQRSEDLISDLQTRLDIVDPGADSLVVTDGVMTNIATNPDSSFAGALTTRIDGRIISTAGVVRPADHGVPVDGVADATVKFQALIDSLPAWATIESRPSDVYRMTGQLNLSKPVTIRGGRFMASPTSTTLSINADDVTLDSFRIDGTNAAAGPVTSQNFIRSNGSSADRRKRAKIRNLVMTECQYIFVYLDWMTEFIIEHNVMINGQYAGIILVSPKGGRIFDNTVRTILHGGAIVNSYGIMCTDSENTDAARAEDVDIIGNLVDGVKDWEGIDTHGGRNIKVIGNTVRNTRCPIAITTGNTSRLMPPQDCTVIGNFLEKGTANSERAGIVFNSNVSNPVPCSGVIGPNIIRGFVLDLDLINWDPERTTVAPQNTSSTSANSKFSPTPSAFRSWSKQILIPVTNGRGSVSVTFPANHFTQPPLMQATKNSSHASSLRLNTYVTAVTATGCTVGLYDPTQAANTLVDIAVHVTATQASSASSEGIYRV